MGDNMVFLSNPAVLVWLTVSHTLFLVIPGLMGAWDEVRHTVGSIHFKNHIHSIQPRSASPHYLKAA